MDSLLELASLKALQARLRPTVVLIEIVREARSRSKRRGSSTHTSHDDLDTHINNLYRDSVF